MARTDNYAKKRQNMQWLGLQGQKVNHVGHCQMTVLLYYRVHRFRKFIVMVHLLKRALFTAHSTIQAGISRVCDFTNQSSICHWYGNRKIDFRFFLYIFFEKWSCFQVECPLLLAWWNVWKKPVNTIWPDWRHFLKAIKVKEILKCKV